MPNSDEGLRKENEDREKRIREKELERSELLKKIQQEMDKQQQQQNKGSK